jgi:phospholipid/cholesterol/gamma-HCH transport system permease protein
MAGGSTPMTSTSIGRRPLLLTVLGAIGRPVVRAAFIVAQAAALTFNVMLRAFTPGTWRRTTRVQFYEALQLAVLNPMRTLLFASFLTGMLLVAQSIYWLRVYGQTETLFSVLLLVLVREIAPIFVGLLTFGRVGLVYLVDLGGANARGNWRMLEANGIDPLEYLVVPRTMALAVSCFCLGMVFIIVTMAVGYMSANLVRQAPRSIWDFYLVAVESFHWRDFVAFPLKSIGIGIVIGLVCTLTGLRRSGMAAHPRLLLPRGFGRAVLAIFGVSLIVDLVV